MITGILAGDNNNLLHKHLLISIIVNAQIKANLYNDCAKNIWALCLATKATKAK